VPIGGEFSVKANSWSFGFTLEYDYFLMGDQYSYLSDVDAGFNILKNKQERGYGMRGSLKLVKKNSGIDFVIEPFGRYWNIKKSTEEELTWYDMPVGIGYEPRNNSKELGVRLGIRF
jgi:hypothetical protein